MDLYAVLGLAAGASNADIKRAYRRLARRYHPGINPGDRTAEALFHRITEAYETLVDPARREKYDSGGHGPPAGGTTQSFEFAGFDFTVAAQGAQAATFTELFADGALVPFEVDQLDETGDEGWSVLVRGRLEAQDGAEPVGLGSVSEGAAQPPAGHSELVLRLTPVQVTGRRRSAG